MMPMFFAQRVILGKIAFEDVPRALKAKTAEILIDSGFTQDELTAFVITKG